MEGAASLADALEGGAAFRVLQTLVQNWLLAAVQYSSACASNSIRTRQYSLLQKPIPW